MKIYQVQNDPVGDLSFQDRCELRAAEAGAIWLSGLYFAGEDEAIASFNVSLVDLGAALVEVSPRQHNGVAIAYFRPDSPEIQRVLRAEVDCVNLHKAFASETGWIVGTVEKLLGLAAEVRRHNQDEEIRFFFEDWHPALAHRYLSLDWKTEGDRIVGVEDQERDRHYVVGADNLLEQQPW